MDVYKDAFFKNATVDPAVLDKATQLARGHVATSIPITAPVALLAAAITSDWSDADVLQYAGKSNMRHMLDAYVPGKGYYLLKKLDRYKKDNPLDKQASMVPAIFKKKRIQELANKLLKANKTMSEDA